MKTRSRYNTDTKYMHSVNHIINGIPIPIYTMLRADLQSLGYAPYELFDAIHEYLATADKVELQQVFPSVEYAQYAPFVNALKELQ